MNLEPTGERMILEHYKSSPEDYVIRLFHLATYRYAAGFTRDKRVLDYGCGSGYGSATIAGEARHVVAVDVAQDAIDYARERYAMGNLEFLKIDPVEPLPFDDASFETVLSFQVLEHVVEADRYLREIRRVLVPRGTLLLVTPDRSTRLLPGQRPWNQWHVREYGRADLQKLMARHFAHVDLMGMTGTRDVIDIEVRRCRRIKWMTLPLTLPIIPDSVRVAALNLVHRLRGADARLGKRREYPFGIDDIVIAAEAVPSVNLVAVAT